MNEYIIIGSAIDYGRGQDGKEWTGLRLVVQEQKSNGTGAVTSVVKCGVPLDKLPPVGARCHIYFDKYGRVALCECCGK